MCSCRTRGTSCASGRGCGRGGSGAARSRKVVFAGFIDDAELSAGSSLIVGHCRLAPDVDERRRVIGHGPTVERDGSDPALGPLVRVTGVTARGRAVVIRAQAERLPMTVVALEGDREAPLPREAA